MIDSTPNHHPKDPAEPTSSWRDDPPPPAYVPTRTAINRDLDSPSTGTEVPGSSWIDNPPPAYVPTRSPIDRTPKRIGHRAILPEGSSFGSWDNPGFSTRTGIEGTFSIVGENDFELTMTDAVRHMIKDHGGMARTRKEFEELIARLLADPHGETNIDHFKDTDAGRLVRHVHRVEGPLSELMGGKPLALKATGLDIEASRAMGLGSRSGLRDQFRSTLFVRRQLERIDPENAMIDGVIGVADIYGVLSYRNPYDGKLQEWMLMENIEGADPMSNERIALAVLGGGPNVALGFERADYPEMAAFYDKHEYSGYQGRYKRDLIGYKDIAKYLYKELKISPNSKVLDDLNGNNILVREQPDGSKQYFLIDIQSH